MGAWTYQIYFSCWTLFNMHTLYFINYAKYFNTDNWLQNSYVLRILCFWGEGDWLGVCVGGGGGEYETVHLIWGRGGGD
jgi:hypothetical protein